MHRGDIITIKFPFTDLSNYKIRPAIVLSNDSYNKYGTIVVAGIFGNPGVSEYGIEILDSYMIGCSLQKKSYIRFQNIFCLHTSLIHSSLGSIKKDFLDLITQKYSSYLV